MEFDIELITRRYIWRQIRIFAKICVRFKDAACERLVLIINESKLKQGKSLRIRGVIAHRGVECYDICAGDSTAYRTIRCSAIVDAVAEKYCIATTCSIVPDTAWLRE